MSDDARTIALMQRLQENLAADLVILDAVLGRGFVSTYMEALQERLEDTGFNLTHAACLVLAENQLWDELQAMETFLAAPEAPWPKS